VGVDDWKFRDIGITEVGCPQHGMESSPMSAVMKQSWVEYYQKVYAADNSSLDYSSNSPDRGEILQAQTFGIAIESAGLVRGKRCLDIGCGRGQLMLSIAALQAKEAVGVDIIADSINKLRIRHPHVRWEAGSLEDASFCHSLGQFDVVFIIELLQLVDWRASLRTLWDMVSPGGRIVAICPNKDNAIIQKTIARFGGSFGAPNPTELIELVDELPDLDCWAYRGMDFQKDQRIVPYVTLPWTNTLIENFECNRLVIVIQKESKGS
jgi:2-polyprenyl-3-methyl-5-hydroxy-6-metoxy-1,4-benzoquinol methylase